MKHLRSSEHREAHLREAVADDEETLLGLFSASREDLLTAISTWDEVQQETFMRIQFQAQRDEFRSQYPHARLELIIRQGETIGQILVAPIDNELHLVDMSLLPEFRNRGIGNALLRDLLDRAAAENKCVTLSVLQDNPAVRLYLRLGFNDTEGQGIYRCMQWTPASSLSADNKARLPTSVS